MHVGFINENKGKNWILGSLNYIIMFVNMKYYFAYLKSTYQMTVSDETSLISSEVECMGLSLARFWPEVSPAFISFTI